MRKAEPRIGVDAALQLIAHNVAVLPGELVSPRDAHERITAQSVFPRRLVPPVRMSAMDGYALTSAKTVEASAENLVRVALASGDIRAGHPAVCAAAGTAKRISTGGTIPIGADCVLPLEMARVSGTDLVIDAPCQAGRNIRMAGEDFSPGSPVLESARLITPAAIGAMIAGAVDEISVRRLPRIALFTTGSELTGASGLARDSNGPMIEAIGREVGIPVGHLGPVRDAVASIAAVIGNSPDCDILVSTGGASVGDHDLVSAALKRCGARILFHGVSMRPGKPILFALLADGRAFFGLPGNPVSAYLGFRFFVIAAVRRMLDLEAEQGLPIATDATARDDLTLFLRARLRRMPDGRPYADTDLNQQSHILSSIIASSCWVRLDPGSQQRGPFAYPMAASFDRQGWVI
jgi:molybdopterin molybdotransferase